MNPNPCRRGPCPRLLRAVLSALLSLGLVLPGPAYALRGPQRAEGGLEELKHAMTPPAATAGAEEVDPIVKQLVQELLDPRLSPVVREQRLAAWLETATMTQKTLFLQSFMWMPDAPELARVVMDAFVTSTPQLASLTSESARKINGQLLLLATIGDTSPASDSDAPLAIAEAFTHIPVDTLSQMERVLQLGSLFGVAGEGTSLQLLAKLVQFAHDHAKIRWMMEGADVSDQRHWTRYHDAAELYAVSRDRLESLHTHPVLWYLPVSQQILGLLHLSVAYELLIRQAGAIDTLTLRDYVDMAKAIQDIAYEGPTAISPEEAQAFEELAAAVYRDDRLGQQTLAEALGAEAVESYQRTISETREGVLRQHLQSATTALYGDAQELISTLPKTADHPGLRYWLLQWQAEVEKIYADYLYLSSTGDPLPHWQRANDLFGEVQALMTARRQAWGLPEHPRAGLEERPAAAIVLQVIRGKFQTAVMAWRQGFEAERTVVGKQGVILALPGTLAVAAALDQAGVPVVVVEPDAPRRAAAAQLIGGLLVRATLEAAKGQLSARYPVKRFVVLTDSRPLVQAVGADATVTPLWAEDAAAAIGYLQALMFLPSAADSHGLLAAGLDEAEYLQQIQQYYQ